MTTRRLSLNDPREKKLIWEMDSYSTKFNSVLKDNPLVQHLLPIETGTDDLAYKLRDGLLISAFINQIPGYKNIVDTKKLHTVDRMPDGSWETLNMFQLAQNQDMMLQAARFIGVNVGEIGVLDLIEGPKNLHLITKLCAEVNNFESMELIAMNADGSGTYKSDSESDSRFNSLKGLSETRKVRKMKRADGQVDQAEDQRENEKVIRGFLNEQLEAIGVSDRVEPKMTLSQALNDSRIYLMILHHLDPQLCPIDAIESSDLHERARAVLANAKALGAAAYIQDYDIVYGESSIHFQFCAGIITCASTLKKDSSSSSSGKAVAAAVTVGTAVEAVKRHSSSLDEASSKEEVSSTSELSLAESEELVPIVKVSELEEQEEKKYADSLEDSYEEYEEEIEIEEYVQEEAEDEISHTSSGPSLVSIEAPLPIPSRKSSLASVSTRKNSIHKPQDYEVGPEQSYDLEGGFTAEAEELLEDSMPDEPSISRSESNAYIKASRDMRLRDKRGHQENYISNLFRMNSNGDGSWRPKVAFVLMFFAVTFLILGILARTMVPRDSGTDGQALNEFLPITADSAQIQGRTTTVNYYLYNYTNLDLAAADGSVPLEVEQIGPFSYERTLNIYNVTFSEQNSMDVIRFMQRSDYVANSETLTLLADTTKLVTPAQKYTAGLGSSSLNDFVSRGSTAIPALEAYYSNVLPQIFSNLCVPVYFAYISSALTSSFGTSMQQWGQLQNVFYDVGSTNTQVVPLNNSISNAAIDYIMESSNTYSLMTRSTSLTTGPLAWIDGSYDAAIAADMLAVSSVPEVDGLQYVATIREWIAAVYTEEDYLSTVRTELVGTVSAGNSVDDLDSWKNIALLQFAQGDLVGYLSNSALTTMFESENVFGPFPFDGLAEMDRFLSTYYTDNLAMTIPEALKFFENFADFITLGSFFATQEQQLGISSQPFIDAGVTQANQLGYAAFLKHVLRFDYIQAASIGTSRNLPPQIASDPGMFVLQTANQMFSTFEDPNDPGDSLLASLDLLPPALENYYTSDDSHWSANKYDYNVVSTGTDDVSNVYQISQWQGQTRVLGVWADSSEDVGGYDIVGVEPGHGDSPLASVGFWEDHLQRVLSYDLSAETVSYSGVDTRRYYIQENELQNDTVHPTNSLYYMYGPGGLLNTAPFSFGASVWVSKPNFLDADSSATEGLASSSFSASQNSHDSYVDIEPSTGLVYQSASRWQYNLQVQKRDFVTEPGYSTLFDEQDSIYLPLYWMEEIYDISEDDSSSASSFLNQEDGDDNHGTVVVLWIVFFIFSGVCLIAALYLIHVHRKRSDGAVQVRPGMVNIH